MWHASDGTRAHPLAVTRFEIPFSIFGCHDGGVRGVTHLYQAESGSWSLSLVIP